MSRSVSKKKAPPVDSEGAYSEAFDGVTGSDVLAGAPSPPSPDGVSDAPLYGSGASPQPPFDSLPPDSDAGVSDAALQVSPIPPPSSLPISQAAPSPTPSQPDLSSPGGSDVVDPFERAFEQVLSQDADYQAATSGLDPLDLRLATAPARAAFKVLAQLVAPAVQYVDEVRRQGAATTHINTLKSAHPDYEQHAPGVQEWIASMPEGQMKQAMQQIASSGAANDVSELLNMYKQLKGIQQQLSPPPAQQASPPPVQQDDTLQQRLQSGAPVKTRRPVVVPNAGGTLDDYAAAFKEVT